MDSKTLANFDSPQVHEKNDGDHPKVANDCAGLSSSSDSAAPAIQVSASAPDLVSHHAPEASAGGNPFASVDSAALLCPLDAAAQRLGRAGMEAENEGIEFKPTWLIKNAHVFQSASASSDFVEELQKAYLASGDFETSDMKTLKRKAPSNADDYVSFGSSRSQRQPWHFASLGAVYNAPHSVSGGSFQKKSGGISSLNDDALIKALDKKHKDIEAFRIASQEAYDNWDTACEDASCLWNELHRRYRSKSQAPHHEPRGTAGEERYDATVVTSDDVGVSEEY